MKYHIILNALFIGLSVGIGTISAHKEVFIKERLNTQENHVGITEDELCHVIYNTHPGKNECMVICEGKGGEHKVFQHVGKVIGSATGIPGWLEYKNYIGSKAMDTGKEGHGIGGIKRIILCDGPCEKKEESHHEHSKMKIMPIEVGE